MILSVHKQPAADTVKLTREIEAALADLGKCLPPGIQRPQTLFKQADFIEHSITNVAEALRDGAIMVALVLFTFLLNVRTTIISLSKNRHTKFKLSFPRPTATPAAPAVAR